MNILPKKSWHVRNKDNVAKVKKDEENARLEEKEQSRRAALAEQEARTNFLRQKARARFIENGDGDVQSILDEGSNNETKIVPANFFSDSNLERGATSSQKNIEHEREKKEEQINYEKQIGLLTYLGQSAAEGKEESDKPWYFRVPDRGDGNCKSSTKEDVGEKDLKRKSSMDPIHVMKDHVSKKRKIDSIKIEKKHKSNKHKHRKHEKERDIPRNSSTNDKLAKLRQERLKREKKERERTLALFGESKKNDDDSRNDVRGRYSNQFNPHLARRRSKH